MSSSSILRRCAVSKRTSQAATFYFQPGGFASWVHSSHNNNNSNITSTYKYRRGPLWHQQQQQSRLFSDRMMGYSPMAGSIPFQPPQQQQPSQSPQQQQQQQQHGIPTAQDVTTAGGVWAPTSAKRDKLTELKAALVEEGLVSLDQAATDLQRLDLYLADGIAAIAAVADSNSLLWPSSNADSTAPPLLLKDEEWQVVQHVEEYLVSSYTKLEKNTQLHQIQWEEQLHDLIVTAIDPMLAKLPADRYLQSVRDYVDFHNSPSVQNILLPKTKTTTPTTSTTAAAAATTTLEPSTAPISGSDNNKSNSSASNDAEDDILLLKDPSAIPGRFSGATIRFRLHMAKAAAEMLKSNWKILTTVSDQDIDRAATQGKNMLDDAKRASTLPADKMQAVIHAYLTGTCQDRVDALWALLDHGDQDGRLDQIEMNRVCEFAIQPVQVALQRLFDEALDAYPVRAPFLVTTATSPADEKGTTTAANITTVSNAPVAPMGWRQRRTEQKEKKRLRKMFQRTLKNHFDVEVEMAHRLRCIYAWANKAHQNNRIDSVVVDSASSSSGRQRYVELHPKISLSEFREVQREHFTHLDRVGAELLRSFREDLWVQQGTKRQNRELARDCALFLTAVCAIDWIILSL